MQAQLACVFSSIYSLAASSQMKQNKQSSPYWRMSLTNLCRMVSSFSAEPGGAGEKTWLPITLPLSSKTCVCLPLLSRRVTLTLCRVSLRPEQLLHDSLEYLEENSDTPLKRKSPYILKRQAAHTTKSRRPYILKRSPVY
uniref:Neurotensin/neuromedin N n=1 Tax=Anabas testudineus TaxID=64144 RepID=A0A7N6BLB2_ANATE